MDILATMTRKQAVSVRRSDRKSQGGLAVRGERKGYASAWNSKEIVGAEAFWPDVSFL